MAFSLGTDYIGERRKLTINYDYQDRQLDDTKPQVTLNGAAPEVPDGDDNYAQPGTKSTKKQLFGVARGEYDISDQVSVWAAFGVRFGEEANILADPRANADGSTTAYRFDNSREDQITSADIGLRYDFFTGAIADKFIASGSLIKTQFKNAYAF